MSGQWLRHQDGELYWHESPERERCGGKIVFFAPTPDDDDDAALRPEVAK